MGVALDGFSVSEVQYLGTARDVYRRGSGPAVIVIHEMPGITPLVAAFGREVADAGFTAVLPSLFGVPGKPMSAGYVAREFLAGCVSREFSTLAAGRTSPVADWLRRLARDSHAQCGGPGVGAVGMCFTGGFALAMATDPSVVAPVVSQPSLPLPIGRRRRADVGLSPADLTAVRERDCDVLGLRYSGDPVVRAERFETLRRELGDRFLSVELPGSKHSVLTEHRDDESVAKVLQFFRDRLLA